MKFFMSGKKVELHGEPPSVKKVEAFLSQAKNGELLSTAQVCSAVKISGNTLSHIVQYGHLRSYYQVVSHKAYWGNKKTIQALRKETDGNNKCG